METEQERQDSLVELNVLNSALRVGQTPIVQNAWKSGQPLTLHTWCYRLEDGIIRDLNKGINGIDGVEELYRIERTK